jgi:hypothetical protein
MTNAELVGNHVVNKEGGKKEIEVNKKIKKNAIIYL